MYYFSQINEMSSDVNLILIKDTEPISTCLLRSSLIRVIAIFFLPIFVEWSLSKFQKVLVMQIRQDFFSNFSLPLGANDRLHWNIKIQCNLLEKYNNLG